MTNQKKKLAQIQEILLTNQKHFVDKSKKKLFLSTNPKNVVNKSKKNCQKKIQKISPTNPKKIILVVHVLLNAHAYILDFCAFMLDGVKNVTNERTRRFFE